MKRISTITLSIINKKSAMLVTYKVPATEEKTVEVKTPMYVKVKDYWYACLNDNGSILEVMNFDDSIRFITRKSSSYAYQEALENVVKGTPITAEEFFTFAETTRQQSESITLQTEAI
jgi:hypothetical protein